MSLKFGTAGLRAPVGPGEDHMNVTQVTRTTAGLAAWLVERSAKLHIPHPSMLDEEDEGSIGADMYGQDGPIRVAVGYDARYGSHTFACTAAEVFAGAGFEVLLLPTPTPTPVMPWLVKSRGLDAGVQITASHNPAADNGYKVYVAGGAQLVSPDDRAIEEHIQAVGDPLQVPRVSVRPGADPLRRYIDDIVDRVNPVEGDKLRVNNERAALSVVFTAMHGVGGRAMNQALQAAGFARSVPVDAQQHPDPTFPTVDFPNPEEPGATDLLLLEGARQGADVLIALDPDADRCAVGVPCEGGFRMLRGDELGPLLATRLVPTFPADRGWAAPVVATTVVSSQLLGEIARDRGWDFQETLTGFKNLARAGDGRPGELVFAYEEAIGTCPFPDVVPDKDGIATALVTCAWAAELKASGRSLADELEALFKTYGRFAGAQVSVRTSDPAALVDTLIHHAPSTLVGLPVDSAPLRSNQGVVLNAGDDEVSVRVIARASGTEPKAKFYIEVSHCGDMARAEELLEAVTGEVRSALSEL
ncbi:phospho-sugar mutase [Corynebacterium aquilae]|uniref:Phosphoglucomutase n=1 Tax=Corynebacterium aquilae DSM 44791 TaxID=1431546 RepID=A0A1L7CE66_9CORY|nr:phospho-sugar mutase [Corynebacterium aquilae]APT84141.1 phosphoglucomutase [Corynebacterium aquilae DSM 44791]